MADAIVPQPIKPARIGCNDDVDVKPSQSVSVLLLFSFCFFAVDIGFLVLNASTTIDEVMMNISRR